MPNYLKNIGDVSFGAGDLKVNLTDTSYKDADFSKFISVGVTEKEFGAVLRLAEPVRGGITRENDRSAPAVEWVTSQDVYFETILLESSLENFVLSLGSDIALIGDNTTSDYKYFRGGGLVLPRHYPFLYEIPQDENPSLTDRIIMPNCEVVGAIDFEFKDLKVRGLRLVLKLHKVVDLSGSNLTTNGSFEVQSVAEKFVGWTRVASGTSEVEPFIGSVQQLLDGDGNRIEPITTGLKSARLTVDASGSEASLSQSVAVEINKDYVFSLNHSSTGVNKSLTVTLGSSTYTVVTSQSANKFLTYSITFKPASSPLLVKVRGTTASSTFYIDDALLGKNIESTADSSLHGKKFEIRRAY